jgi:gliding motility-associated-like protein
MKNKLIFIAISLLLNFVSNAQCFEIESILVDACGSLEGENEMVRFKVGNQDLCTNDLSVTWANANNPWLGITQNATTAQITADLNATIVSCGYLIEPTTCVLPANSKVLLVTSTAIDINANSFANLGDTLYIIFQTAGNTNGHFANYNSAGGLRTLAMNFSNPLGCSDQVTYDRGNLVNINGTTGGTTAQKNGSTVVFDPAGNPTYINNGCQAPVDPFIIDMTATEINSGTQMICPGDIIAANVSVTGVYQEIIWSGGDGTFDTQNVTSTNYNSTASDTLDFYLYSSVVNTCNDTVVDSVLITVNSSPVLTQIGPFTTYAGTQQVPSTMTGGTWTSNCGACLSSNGVFDPAVSGEGTFQICHQAGCGQDCINIVVDNSCTMSLTYTYQNPICFAQPSGSINVTATGIVGSVSYVITDANNNVLNSSNTPIVNNLTAGWYYFSVTDDLCTLMDSVELIEPNQIEAYYTVVNNNCYGDSLGQIIIDSVLYNNGPYIVSWNLSPLSNSLGVNDTAFTLPAGNYDFTIIDSLNCQRDYVNLDVYQAEPINIENYVVTKVPLCRIASNQDAHGQISVTVSGGLTISGTGNDFVNSYWQNISTGDTWNSTTYPGINPGYYTFYAVNELGCVRDSTFYLDSISPIANFTTTSPQFTSDYIGTAVVEVTFENFSENYDFANNADYNGNNSNSDVDTLFTWYFIDAENNTEILHTESLSPIVKEYLSEGLYTVCLEVEENLNHCIDSTCVEIQIYDQPNLIAPNVFTPDGDGTNDEFYLPSSALITLSCQIFDRWGNQVYEFTSPTDTWDGSNMKNSKPCTDGVYFYVYEAESSNGTKYKGQGNIQLIRK